MIIGLLLYPYLIRVLGKESYGTYVFVLSNINFFIAFISFGFSFPALKAISLHPTDAQIKSLVVSKVITAKFCLFLLSGLFLFVLMCFVPYVRENALLYLLVFLSALNEVLFPVYYFQGMQKMRFVTCVQLSIRLLTIPLVLVFVKNSDSVLVYALIVSGLSVLGGLFSVIYLRYKENVAVRLVSVRNLRDIFRDSVPFFWSMAFGTTKQEMVILFIGGFFSKQDVAVYDLANKIITIPRIITNNINSAIFPSIIKDVNVSLIKKITNIERVIGLSVIFLIAILGYWAVLILGGKPMLDAYPLAVVLSVTIYSWLIVGCYINYVFVPSNSYSFVSKNQFVALFSFFIIFLLGMLVCRNVLMVVIAYTLSSIAEMCYCKYVIKKHDLLYAA